MILEENGGLERNQLFLKQNSGVRSGIVYWKLVEEPTLLEHFNLTL